MQSGSGDKRTDIQSLIREADIDDEPLLKAESEIDGDQVELSTLTSKHENLRRQVALLKARLAETQKKSEPEAEVTIREPGSAVTALLVAASSAMLAAWLFWKKRADTTF